MAQTYGPQYPFIEDGLVFAFDPKNRDCWKGGFGPFYNLVNEVSSSVVSGVGADEVNGAITSEGYIHWDGTDSVVNTGETNTSLGLVGTNQMSAMFWATNDDSTMVEWSAPMGATTNNAYSDGWSFYTNNSYDKMNFFVEHYLNNLVISNDAMPTDGTWFNVCGVYDGTLGSDNIKLYVNGVQQTSTDNYTGNITQDGSWGVFLGRTSGYAGYNWDGKAGPCAIWNRPLSSAEVMTNFNRLKGRFGL